MKTADGAWLKTPEEVHQGAVDYFQTFLAATHPGALPELDSLVDKVIFDVDNVCLPEPPSIHEIKAAVFSIPTDSSPGPDGYGSGFYKACWDIVSKDVVKAVQEFFKGSSISKLFCHSFLTLIPKVDNPKGLTSFVLLVSVSYSISCALRFSWDAYLLCLVD